MRKFLVLFSALALLTACKNGDQNNGGNQEATAGLETPKVALAEFHEQAGNFVDKEVVTQGIVDHVCRHGGKRLFLVSDEADLHIDGNERFDEDLTGSEIEVKGIVREFRVDEAYCLKMEEDNINSHSKGETDEETYKMKMDEVAYYRDSMKVAGVDHLSYYSLDYLSHKEIK